MLRRAVLAVAVVVAFAAGGDAAPKAAAKTDTAGTDAFFRQMGEAQKWVGEELWNVKQQVEALPGAIAEVKEGHTATQEEIAKVRDEVKGLYIELSTVKQQIEALRGEIGGVNTNVSGFRTFSGFFLALMIIMVAIIFVMTIRR